MSASALAVGIIVISRTSGMTTDVDNYMFGSVLAMTWADVALSAVLSLAVLALFVLFYHKLFAVTFDESFSRATGLRVDWYNTLLAILTALTIVAWWYVPPLRRCAASARDSWPPGRCPRRWEPLWWRQISRCFCSPVLPAGCAGAENRRICGCAVYPADFFIQY